MKKFMRGIAASLAAILVLVTIGNDYSMIAMADDAEVVEVVEEAPAEIPAEPTVTEITYDDEGTPEFTEVVEEPTEEVSEEIITEESDEEDLDETEEDLDEELEEELEEELLDEEDVEDEEPAEEQGPLTFGVNDEEMGYVEEITETIEDEEVLVGATAYANEGYVFVNWTDADGAEVATEATYEPGAEAEGAFTANFEAEEEDEFPAQEFEATVDNIVISVSAPEGAFPEGTEMNAVKVVSEAIEEAVDEATGEDTVVEEYVAFDITFTKDGEEIEPAVPVSVNFANVELEGENLQVFHMEDEEAEAEAVSEAVENTDEIEVQAESFSLYILVGQDYRELRVGEKIELEVGEKKGVMSKDEDTLTGYNSLSITKITWTIADTSVAELVSADTVPSSRYYPTADIQGLKEGTTTLTVKFDFSYKKNGKTKNGNKSFTYDVVVKSASTSGIDKVAVLATVGNQEMNDDILNILGLQKGLHNNYYYYPVGIIELPKSILSSTTFDVPLIKSESDVQAVKDAISVIDSSWISDSFAGNRGNNVGSYVQCMQPDINQKSGSGKTALFYWGKEEQNEIDHGPSEFTYQTVNGKKAYYNYHLDMRFATVKVTYYKKSDNSYLGEQVYLKSTPSIDPKDTIGDYLSKLGKEYAVKGYYTKDNNGNYTKYEFNQTLENDLKLYLDLEKVNKLTIKYDVNGGSSTTTSPTPTNGVYSFDVYPNDNMSTINEPTRDGYIFIGWEEQSTQKILAQSELPKRALQNETYVAQWEDTKVRDEITVYISGATEEFEYDGTSHTASGWTVTNITGNSTYKAEDVALKDGITASVSGIDVDTYEMGLDKNSFVNTNDKYTNVKFVVTDGKLTITPNDQPVVVTIEGNTKTETYDGTKKEVDGYTVTSITVNGQPYTLYKSSDFALKQGVTAHAEGIKADTYSMGLTKDSFTNNNTKFKKVTFAVSDGTLTISPIDSEITVTAKSDNKYYDGTPLTNAGYDVTGSLAAGDVVTATVEGTITDAGEIDNIVTSVVIKNAAGKVVTSNYSKITEQDGKLTVKPRTVTLTSGTHSKQYDGTPLKKEEVTETPFDAKQGLGFIAGEGVDNYSNFASQTEVGSTENTFEYTLKNNTKATNYNITKTLGTLTVSENDKVVVTITEHSALYTYNGETRTASGYDVSTSDSSYKESDFEFTGNASVSGIDVGTYDMELKPEDFVNKNKNFKNVTFKIVDGQLEITPITTEIIITANNASKKYDGTPLTDSGVTYTENVLLEGDVLTATVEGTITDAGEVANVVKSYKVMRGSKDVTKNYTFGTPVDGTLTVTKRTVKLQSATDSKEYDGTALTNHEVVVLEDGFAGQEGATYTVTGTITDPGEVDNEFTYALNSNTKADNYIISTEFGKLTVTNNTKKVVVTVSGDKKEFTYDGTEKKAEGYSVDSITLDGKATTLYTKDDFVFNGTAIVTRTNAGTSPMGLSTDQFENTNEKFADVEFVVNDGELKINPIASTITVTAKSGKKFYDGTPLTNDGYAYDKSILANGDVLTAIVTGTITDAGEIDNVVTSVVIKNAAGADVTANYPNIKLVPGKLTVEKRNVTLTSGSASKSYDGTALTNHEVTATPYDDKGNGFVDGDMPKCNVIGTITAPGEVDNEFTYTTSDILTKNYNISVVKGKLTVTDYAGEVTVTTTGGEFTYDGKEHKATVEVTGLPEIYTVNRKGSNAKATDVTKEAIEAKCDTLQIVNMKGDDVTDKLKIKYVPGTLKINPATLTVTTPTDSKVYDGDPLTKEGTISGFVNNETATFKTTGSQTEVGSSKNTYSLVFDGTAKKDNYKVSESLGTLTVTQYADEIVVTTTGGEFTYDGKPHGATVQVSTLPTGYTLKKATSSATATHVADGIVKADCDTLVITNKEGVDVTSKLNIRKVPGTIKIKPATLTVTTLGASRAYDGTALTADGSVDGYKNGETATFTVTGSQTIVGTSDNTYTLVFDKTAKESDYTVTKNVGTLEVYKNQAAIVVTADSTTRDYDGTALTNSNYSFEGTVAADEKVVAEIEGTITDAGSVDNVVKSVKVMRGAEDVSANYDFGKHVNGKLTVDPAKLTVTTPSKEKVYDGTALTYSEGAEFKGLVNEETATFTVTGTQTKVGSSDNTYEIKWDGTANKDNYVVETENLGTLKVTEFAGAITVTTTGGTFTYDGLPHKATVKVTGLPESGYTVKTAESTATATDVTTEAVNATCNTLEIINAEGVDVTDKLKENISYKDGSIVINPASVTVITPSADKVYDGTALTYSEGAEIVGLVNGETATLNVTGTQTEVGSSDNTYEIVWADTTTSSPSPKKLMKAAPAGKKAKSTNYTVIPNMGKLTVKEYPDEIVVTTVGGVFTYDGTAHGATVTVGDLPAGYRLDTASSNATATHVAEGVVPATADNLIIRNMNDENVTGNLKIKYVDGSIEITPATLTIVTDSASKYYDGTALTAVGTITGFIGDETATFTVTGSQTSAGSSANTYTLVWDGSAVETDYTLDEYLGTLTVNATPDTPPTPPEPPVIIPPAPVPLAPLPDAAVLGARREEGDGSVLGARRGQDKAVLGKRRSPATGDSLAIFAWIAGLVTAIGGAIAAGMGLKKNEK